MLLSHNFNVPETLLPALSREAFVEVFRSALSAQPGLQCQPVDNPHWIVEVRFASSRLPLEVGQVCLQALVASRRHHLAAGSALHWLALGGLKSTPAKGKSPSSLQMGEWGVDVIETPSAEAFLQALGWQQTVAEREPGTVFKVEIRNA